MNSKAEEVTTLKEEVRRLQKLLSQRDETLEEEKGRNVQLQFEKEDLHARVRTPRHPRLHFLSRCPPRSGIKH